MANKSNKLRTFNAITLGKNPVIKERPAIRLSFYFDSSDHHTEFPLDIESDDLACQLIDLARLIQKGNG
jgi:hypothetical protein